MNRRFTWKMGMGMLILALAVMLNFAGCKQETSKQPQNNQTDKNQKPDIDAGPKDIKEKITLYFGDKEAMHLVPEEREAVVENKQMEEVVIAELIKGPCNSDMVQTVPKEARLISVEVVDGVAYVNFNKEFQTKHWGGSAGETMTLYSITNSLAKLPNIKKVQFLLEGKKQEAILGHTDTTEAIPPNWSIVKEK